MTQAREAEIINLMEEMATAAVFLIILDGKRKISSNDALLVQRMILIRWTFFL